MKQFFYIFLFTMGILALTSQEVQTFTHTAAQAFCHWIIK